ncbi:MAG: hypothetical protein ACE5FT_07890 [Candidatus Nanoarchaeia archaeon]
MKEQFMKAYANLPVPEREQVVVVIDGVPYSWTVAYHEVENDTGLGKKILNKLKELGIL